MLLRLHDQLSLEHEIKFSNSLFSIVIKLINNILFFFTYLVNIKNKTQNLIVFIVIE